MISIWKGFAAVLLITTVLCMLLPSPAFAGLDEGVMIGVLAVVAVFVLIFGIYKVWEWDDYFGINPGDVYLKMRSGLLPFDTLANTQDAHALLNRSMEYDIDWLLTDRSNGSVWAGAGFTIQLMPDCMEFIENDIRYGQNIMLGYGEDAWDSKLLMLYFNDGEFQTNVNITYRF